MALTDTLDNFEIFRWNNYSEPRTYNGMSLRINQQPYLDIVLTDKCNRHCGFCIADLLDKKEDCDLKVFESQIEYAIKEFGVQEVLIVGGEPTIAKNLFSILNLLDFYREEGRIKKICITTNGDRLKKGDFLPNLTNYVTHINLSLMCNDLEKQTKIAGADRSLTQTNLERIHTWCRDNIHLRINNNIFRDNHDSLEKVMAFYNQVKDVSNSVKFSPLLRVDNFSVVNKTTEFVRNNILTPDEYETLFKQIEQHYVDFPIVRNPLTFGFVEYSMICMENPVLP